MFHQAQQVRHQDQPHRLIAPAQVALAHLHQNHHHQVQQVRHLLQVAQHLYLQVAQQARLLVAQQARHLQSHYLQVVRVIQVAQAVLLNVSLFGQKEQVVEKRAGQVLAQIQQVNILLQ